MVSSFIHNRATTSPTHLPRRWHLVLRKTGSWARSGWRQYSFMALPLQKYKFLNVNKYGNFLNAGKLPKIVTFSASNVPAKFPPFISAFFANTILQFACGFVHRSKCVFKKNHSHANTIAAGLLLFTKRPTVHFCLLHSTANGPHSGHKLDKSGQWWQRRSRSVFVFVLSPFRRVC